MRIKGILTERRFRKGASFQIVFEWEDAFSDKLQIPKYSLPNYFYFLIRNIVRFKLGWLFLALDSVRPIKSYYLLFDMEATTYLRIPSLKNIIPIIIDFWLPRTEFPSFYKLFANAKLVFITSKEVFDLLKTDRCPLPIVHFPLSIPDKYISPRLSSYRKSIDFIFAGRRDPIFFQFVQSYENENPEIEYIYKGSDNDSSYYSNKRGKLPRDYYSRENYKSLVRASRIAFYSTPGNDPSKENANGYNQVTPRFLELISNGCLVMARYPQNADVDFFELKDICFTVNCYEDFTSHMKLFSNEEFVKNHIDKYYSYLNRHSTSNRVALLQKLLNENY